MLYVIKGRSQTECRDKRISIDIDSEFAGAPEAVKLGAAIQAAVRVEADLSYTELVGAALIKAKLMSAELTGADLTAAQLAGADCSDAILAEACLYDADIEGAVLERAILADAMLRKAGLRRAVLIDAVLAGANFTRAELGGADLNGANLTAADLSGAELAGANLRRADFSSANLAGAVLPSGLPVVERIDARILQAIEAAGNFVIDEAAPQPVPHWRAAWAVRLASEAGAALALALGEETAGALIYAASRPNQPVPDFYTSDEDAMADLRACASARTG